MSIKYDGVPEHCLVSLMEKAEWQKVRQAHYTGRGLDQDFAFQTLLQIKEVFDQVGCKFYVTNGTALGFYRENRFLPWDDEIDIDVLSEDFMPVFYKVAALFVERGFIVRATPRKELSKMALFIGGLKVAVGGIYWDSDQPEYRQGAAYRWLDRFYREAIPFEFRGHTFWLPGPKDEYLTYCYGANWGTPIQSDDPEVYMNRESGQFKYERDSVTAKASAAIQGSSWWKRIRERLAR